MHITDDSTFTPGQTTIRRGYEDTFYEQIQGPRPSGVTTRALFLNKPSGSVLQILGTKYQIEPFFFSSSLNWIPTRYQERLPDSNGDHITITLPFISVVSGRGHDGHQGGILPVSDNEELIIVHEMLAVHMIRSSKDNTVISFHPNDSRSTAALHLRSRIMDAGLSVYWVNILKATHDPTFILLIYMWYAMYAWDQALEQLYIYISRLERRTTSSTDDQPSQTLHNIHAHLLSYTTMLRDFKKSVQFIMETPVTTIELDEEEQHTMHRECNNLISEIERLDLDRATHTERLKNLINLLFSSINLHDSEQMRKLTQVTVRDSRAMKQVSILTMIFLPASFIATVFGMNITALSSDPDIKGTLEHYIETAIPLTLLTIWFIVASQAEAPGSQLDSRGWQRLAWPYTTFKKWLWPDILDLPEFEQEVSTKA
ncbi:hypothetical protein DXG01_002818 [Tephrocybe rancida]|nr:hypothetical protein DXG01_002818 [Tephrocybe rancida]